MRLEEASKGSTPTSAAERERQRVGTSAQRNATTWRSRRAGAFSSGRLALMRLSRGKTLLLTVALGILVAVVLIGTVPLYDALVANVQLQRAINTGGPTARNIEVHLGSQIIDARQHAQTDPAVRGLGQRYLAGFTAPTPTYYVVADNMLVLEAGGVTYDPSRITTLQLQQEGFDYAVAAPHMRFDAGGPPQPTPAGASPQVIITKQMSTDYGLKVGETIVTTHYGDRNLHLTLKIVGIWEPTNVSDPFWNGLSFATVQAENQPPTYPIVWNLPTFFADLRQYHQLSMSERWIYYTEPNRISTANAQDVLTNIGSFRSRLSGDLLGANGVTDVAIGGSLDRIMTDVRQQQSLLALPLYVVAAQIVGLALLFVGAMAGLLIEGQSLDIATLKSRGMSGTQILGVYITQGAVLGLLAAIAGPFLAALLGLALVQQFVPGATTSIAGIGPAYFRQIASPRAAVLPAVVGALLGVAAIALAALNAARLEVVAFRREQARPTRQPLWRRYYLDIALAV
nr:hypothetical protein [Ktedonobacterales bacterium]